VSTSAATLVDDGRTIVRQIGYEQRTFWRMPQSALFTFVLPILLLVMFSSLEKGSHFKSLGGVNAVQYFVPSMLAYAIMGVCFVNLAIQVTIRREDGLLKRVRGTPLPAGSFFASLVGNALVVSAIDVVVALAVGRLFFSVELPSEWGPFLVAVVVGVCSFTALALAISSFIPNAEAAPAVVNLPFLVLVIFSGTFYPFPQGSFVSKVANFFPVQHFIKALFAPFSTVPGAPHAGWGNVLAVALWGVAGLLITFRRFKWEPVGK
jgi:ABC-2 type transport system permease protein